MAIRTRKYQFGQYFARNQIILHYRAGCNAESQDTGKLHAGLLQELPELLGKGRGHSLACLIPERLAGF
jgi:hypothetical protein